MQSLNYVTCNRITQKVTTCTCRDLTCALVTPDTRCIVESITRTSIVPLSINLNKGEAILFEGDKVFHKGKKLCKNEKRIILSCTFTTSQEMSLIETIFQRVKNIGIFGEL